MCITGINFRAYLLHSKQQRLNGIDAICFTSSYGVWPTDLIIALPLIYFVNRKMDIDRDINVEAVYPNFRTRVNMTITSPSAKAEWWNGTPC